MTGNVCGRPNRESGGKAFGVDACIYRLAGSDSAKYLTLISAVYSKAADHADVGNYGVGFLDEFRQREELAKYGLRPLWPY